MLTCLIGNQCLRLTPDGKVLKTFQTGTTNYLSGIDLVSNGRVLIAFSKDGLVSEYDGEGRQHWQVKAPGIASATRLPNGHTLLAIPDTKTVTELDRSGKVVWEYRSDIPIRRGRRR